MGKEESEGRRILIVAGEPSGDAIAAGLIQAVRERAPEIRFEGVAGERMEAAGCWALYRAERLAVVGLTEVLRHFPDIRRIFRGLKHHLRQTPPDLLICVDLPDFNLRLAKVAKKACIPVVYYVSPQVWAWRRDRIRTLGRLVEHMLLIFPFETELYRKAGIPATYVGNPIVERLNDIPDSERARWILGLPKEGPIVALLPGSRCSEVRRLGPILLEAAQRLESRFPGVIFVLPVANSDTGEILAELERTGKGPRQAIHTTDSVMATAAADCAAVASGTATLEAAMVGTPLIVLYRLSPLTFWLARRLVQVPYIGMVNLIAGREVVPELIQDKAEPEAVAAALERYLTDSSARTQARSNLTEIRAALGQEPSSHAAEITLSVVGNPR